MLISAEELRVAGALEAISQTRVGDELRQSQTSLFLKQAQRARSQLPIPKDRKVRFQTEFVLGRATPGS